MNYKQLLGAEADVGFEKFTIYLPNKNAKKEELDDIKLWVELATALLGYINGGCTWFEAEGLFYDIPKGQDVLDWDEDELEREKTALVYSYIHDRTRFERAFSKISSFAHTFGQRTNQKTVYVEISGEAMFLEQGKRVRRYRSRTFKISKYDQAAPDTVPLNRLLHHLFAIPN